MEKLVEIEKLSREVNYDKKPVHKYVPKVGHVPSLEELIENRSPKPQPPPPAPPPPPPSPAHADAARLAAYIEAAADPREADRRLVHVLSIINETAETAEEADALAKAISARAKKP